MNLYKSAYRLKKPLMRLEISMHATLCDVDHVRK